MSLYLDASALVKLVVEEEQSPALVEATADAALVASELALAEVPRAFGRARRAAPPPSAEWESLLRRLTLLALDRRVLAAAARIQPPEVRTLDAVHIAAALGVRDDLDGFVTYDRRQRAAAEAVGLPVLAPA